MWHPTDLLILYCQWKSGFTCQWVNTELNQWAITKKPLPTIEQVLKYAAIRGAGGLLGPFHQGLPNLVWIGSPLLLFCQGGQVWQHRGSCSATPEVSAEEPEESSEAGSHVFWWVDLSSCAVLWLCRFPNRTGVSRAQQTAILAARTSWRRLL